MRWETFGLHYTCFMRGGGYRWQRNICWKALLIISKNLMQRLPGDLGLQIVWQGIVVVLCDDEARGTKSHLSFPYMIMENVLGSWGEERLYTRIPLPTELRRVVRFSRGRNLLLAERFFSQISGPFWHYNWWEVILSSFWIDEKCGEICMAQVVNSLLLIQ